MYNSYERIISNFLGLKVLIVGDIMMDSYLKGQSSRICREAPVPIVNVEKIENAPGGAGNTALNLAQLGARVDLLSVSGDDTEADKLIGIFRQHSINTEGIYRIGGRETLAKRRVVSDSQLLVRYDSGSTGPVPPDTRERLLDYLRSAFFKTDLIVISDYEYGVLSPPLIKEIGRLTKKFPKPVIVDAKTVTRYREINITAIKPNYSEFIKILGIEKLKGKERVEQVYREGQRIIDLTHSRIAAITLDADGTVLFEHGNKPIRTLADPADNSKAAGAGDTYVSALALALCAGANTQAAAEIAAAAASIVVHKDGTSTCTRETLLTYFTPKKKILKDIEELDLVCRSLKEQNHRIVFTNGYFDLLHTGHIEFLEEAKKLGDILIIGVNSDESVRRLRESFPINSAPDRMKILAALKMVDYVVGFSENTALRLIQTIKPEIFVKGGTYTKSSLVETQFVEELGGRVEILPYYIPGYDSQASPPNEEERRQMLLL